MLKKTFVVLLVTMSSVTSTIAQPELLLSKVTDLSPKQVVYNEFIPPLTEEIKISYTAWIMLETYYQSSVWYLWFQKGSCTDYASSKRPELFIRDGKRLITGNAKEWLWKAKELWIITSTTPKQWSIAVYLPWDDGASNYGHVAYVEEVWDNGTIIISDMNYIWDHIVSKRTVSVDSAAWYID